MKCESNKQVKGLVPDGKRKRSTRFVVVREYHGNQSMQSAFRQVVENRVCEQYEQWMERKSE